VGARRAITISQQVEDRNAAAEMLRRDFGIFPRHLFQAVKSLRFTHQ
jgi:hypothetical protein